MKRLLNTKQAAEYLGMASRTLENWRYQSRGPKVTHMGGAVRYDVRDLDAYVEAGKGAA